jgi:hypothetical protein
VPSKEQQVPSTKEGVYFHFNMYLCTLDMVNLDIGTTSPKEKKDEKKKELMYIFVFCFLFQRGGAWMEVIKW